MVQDEEERGGLTKQLNDLTSLVEKLAENQKDKKKFKLPLSARLGIKSKLKNNYALVLLLRTNGYVNIKFLPIENDMIYISKNQTYHLATAEYVFRYKKYPLLIIPEYSLKPISPKELMKETIKEGELALPQKVILNAMKLSQLKSKGSFAGKSILWIILGGIVALYFISQIISGGSI